LLLYYITDRTQFAGDEDFRRRALLDKIAEAAACGVDFIQLREKDLPTRELQSLSCAALRVVQHIFRSANEKVPRTRLLINSRVDVAIACGADGVHLRSDDISPQDVRCVWAWGTGVRSTGSGQALARESGPPIIAVSCHTKADVARAASDGADLAVFAPVFEKKDMSGVSATGLAALHEACQQKIPLLALGGVNVDNARSCIDAGAAGIAGIRIFQEREIAGTVSLLRS
jgi:thiamine-phosphate pyrophosphorylase